MLLYRGYIKQDLERALDHTYDQDAFITLMILTGRDRKSDRQDTARSRIEDQDSGPGMTRSHHCHIKIGKPLNRAMLVPSQGIN